MTQPSPAVSVMPASRTASVCIRPPRFAQKPPGGEPGDKADGHRQNNHDGDHEKRDGAAGHGAGHNGIDRKKHKDGHDIVQNCHGQQRVRYGPLRVKFVDDGQRGRGGGGQRDPAEQKGDVYGNARRPEDNREHQRNQNEGAQGLGQGGDNQPFSIGFELFPHELRPQHQPKRALHPHDDGFVPCRVQHGLGHEAKRVGAEKHTYDQPSQNGGQLDPGDQPAGQRGQRQDQKPPQQLRHILTPPCDGK